MGWGLPTASVTCVVSTLFCFGLCNSVFLMAFFADSNPELRVVFRSFTPVLLSDTWDWRRSENLKTWLSLEFLKLIFETGKCSLLILGLLIVPLIGDFPSGFLAALIKSCSKFCFRVSGLSCSIKENNSGSLSVYGCWRITCMACVAKLSSDCIC